MKLSHSAIDLYKTCPKAYEFKYIQRYSETYLSSALFFGSAIGDTFQMMVLDKKSKLTEEEQKIVGSCPYEFFDNHIATGNLNGREIQLINSHEIRYFRGDYEETILTEEDHEIIEQYREENGFEDFHTFENLYSDLVGGKLDEIETSFINLMFWLSVRRRGHLLIKEYANVVLPTIAEVHEIEGEIKIENGEGDEIVGFFDMICDIKIPRKEKLKAGEKQKYDIKTVLVDHKTSSSRYAKDKIQTSQQLSLYDYAKEIGLVGYIVGIKKVKTPKRGPRKGETHTEIQVMFESIPEETQEQFIEDADGILSAIKEGEFPKDESKCKWLFGRRCPYYKLCHEGNDKDLFKKPERK